MEADVLAAPLPFSPPNVQLSEPKETASAAPPPLDEPDEALEPVEDGAATEDEVDALVAGADDVADDDEEEDASDLAASAGLDDASDLDASADLVASAGLEVSAGLDDAEDDAAAGDLAASAAGAGSAAGCAAAADCDDEDGWDFQYVPEASSEDSQPTEAARAASAVARKATGRRRGLLMAMVVLFGQASFQMFH